MLPATQRTARPLLHLMCSRQGSQVYLQPQRIEGEPSTNCTAARTRGTCHPLLRINSQYDGHRLHLEDMSADSLATTTTNMQKVSKHDMHAHTHTTQKTYNLPAGAAGRTTCR